MTNQEQRDVKSKVQSVREVLNTGISSNDISLVLQHFDYNIEQTVAAFLEGQSGEIIHQWCSSNKKTNNTGRRKRKDSQKGPVVEVSCSGLDSVTPTIISTSGSTAEWRPYPCDNPAAINDDTESGYPSSSSSLSSDSQSVTSESGASPAFSADQATDSGCDTTSVLTVQTSSICRIEIDKKKQKYPPPMSFSKLNPADPAACTAACTAISNCFDLLRTRLDERQVSLLQDVKSLSDDKKSDATFICDLRQLLNGIDTFGKVVPASCTPCCTSEMDDGVASEETKLLLVNPGNLSSEEAALISHESQTEADEETEEVLEESGMEGNDTANLKSTTHSRESSLTRDFITPSRQSSVSSENSKVKAQSNKKKSRTKDRRINKNPSGIAVSARNHGDVNEICIEDLISQPSGKSRASVKQDQSRTSSKDNQQKNAYNNSYVFQQSESLTRYEMALNGGTTKSTNRNNNNN